MIYICLSIMQDGFNFTFPYIRIVFPSSLEEKEKSISLPPLTIPTDFNFKGSFGSRNDYSIRKMNSYS